MPGFLLRRPPPSQSFLEYEAKMGQLIDTPWASPGTSRYIHSDDLTWPQNHASYGTYQERWGFPSLCSSTSGQKDAKGTPFMVEKLLVMPPSMAPLFISDGSFPPWHFSVASPWHMAHQGGLSDMAFPLANTGAALRHEVPSQGRG